jgi:methyl-accepting chemotaxis protein
VKALAEQTSRATAEITGHIGAVQSTTDQAANAILGIGKTIDEINHIASTIAAAVEEQGSATEDIARNVDQAAQGTTEVTRNITGVNHAAEAASASTNQVLSFATELAKQSEKLRGEIHKFLIRVRAAKQAESPDGWASNAWHASEDAAIPWPFGAGICQSVSHALLLGIPIGSTHRSCR